MFVENNLMSEKRSSLVMTECTQTIFDFHSVGRRSVQAAFNGGQISSDGGALLLREVDRRFGVIARTEPVAQSIARGFK